MSELHFLRPWALALIVPALLLWLASRRASDTTRRWARVIEPDLLKLLVVGGSSRWRIAPHDLLLVGWIVGALAIAGPAWQREPSPFADAERPLMIVLKVTPSMTTGDLAPSRLDRARQKIADLLKAHDGMPAGLIAYSGSAHLVLPPTQDRGIVLDLAHALSPAIMPREGDRLDEAVALAGRILKEGGQGGSILVVADAVAPGQAFDAPFTLLAMLPEPTPLPVVDQRIVRVTVDDADIKALSRRFATAGAPPAAPGEGERWQEAGYWLTPLLALLAIGWFRRGWVLA
ncbi:MAG: VWA domain-containing protein [Reyranella sp.]|uniref:VWA domain-containing protein n=1 Tax=Reyranella sp. TaxID=1929291 RepID=UPI001ACFC138|nr:VWA domain-containing protein [Reyranella sp.]MBN9085286.1 VWA domain-containing protein [Reyranella sp.]